MEFSYPLPEKMDKTILTPRDDIPTNQPSHQPTNTINKQTNKSLSRDTVLLHKTISM